MALKGKDKNSRFTNFLIIFSRLMNNYKRYIINDHSDILTTISLLFILPIVVSFTPSAVAAAPAI